MVNSELEKLAKGPLFFPIKAGLGRADLAPPWSRDQVSWLGRGYFVLRMVTDGLSRWILGASLLWKNAYPHERVFHRTASQKSEVLRSLRMNPWPVHLAGKCDAKLWRSELSALVEQERAEPIIDTGYLTMWFVSRLPTALLSGAPRFLVLDGHHSRKAQHYLGFDRIFGWIEPLDAEELKVKALHRAGHLSGWLSDAIKDGELRVLDRAPEMSTWTLETSLAFEVVQPERRFWVKCAHAASGETCIDALSRLARQRRVFLHTSPNFDEITSWLQRMEVDTGLRLPPSTKNHVWSRAMSGQLFPQKATSFYPKIPFGLLVQDLK